MTEGAGIARLWQGFNHLSENSKDLVLMLAEAVGRSEQDVQAVLPTMFPVIPKKADGFCYTVSQDGKKER